MVRWSVIVLALASIACGGSPSSPSSASSATTASATSHDLVSPLATGSIQPGGTWTGHCAQPIDRGGVLRGTFDYLPADGKTELILISQDNAPTCIQTTGSCGELARVGGNAIGEATAQVTVPPGQYCVFFRVLPGSPAVQGSVSMSITY